MRRLWLLVVAALWGCAASKAQGGARFDDSGPSATTLAAEELFAVCWPRDSDPTQKVSLIFEPQGEVIFEVAGGASNSTGRCIREIAKSVQWRSRPVKLEASPPRQPIDGWAVMTWVRVLSPGRFGPERGIRDPGPLVAQCFATLGPPRASTSFEVRHLPGFEVGVFPEALTDSERCVEAILGATAWPSAREVTFDFARTAGALPAVGDVSFYGAPDSPSTGSALDPQQVRERIQLGRERVGACWDSALARRTTIGGSRTFRFRVDGDGTVRSTWVTASVAGSQQAADYELDRCLAGVLKSLQFPPHAGEGFFTWNFATR